MFVLESTGLKCKVAEQYLVAARHSNAVYMQIQVLTANLFYVSHTNLSKSFTGLIIVLYLPKMALYLVYLGQILASLN